MKEDESWEWPRNEEGAKEVKEKVHLRRGKKGKRRKKKADLIIKTCDIHITSSG